MASFTTAQLATLPQDVLLYLIPMLANRPETPTQELDRIALEYANWAVAHWNEPANSPPGFVPMTRSYKHLLDAGFRMSEPLVNAFCVFGAKEDVPFTVWFTLSGNGRPRDDIWMLYLRVMRARRLHQRGLTQASAKKRRRTEA